MKYLGYVLALVLSTTVFANDVVSPAPADKPEVVDSVVAAGKSYKVGDTFISNGITWEVSSISVFATGLAVIMLSNDMNGTTTITATATTSTNN